jgi:hypothetical protein
MHRPKFKLYLSRFGTMDQIKAVGYISFVSLLVETVYVQSLGHYTQPKYSTSLYKLVV